VHTSAQIALSPDQDYLSLEAAGFAGGPRCPIPDGWRVVRRIMSLPCTETETETSRIRR
jgi:hypothetical protein